MCSDSSGMFQLGPGDLNPPVRWLTQASPQGPSRISPTPQQVYKENSEAGSLVYLLARDCLLTSSPLPTEATLAPGMPPDIFRPTLDLGITHHHLHQQPPLRGLLLQTPQHVVLLDHPKDFVAGVFGEMPKGGLN